MRKNLLQKSTFGALMIPLKVVVRLDIIRYIKYFEHQIKISAMKKQLLFSFATIILVIFIVPDTAAKIWRVNNNAGVTADFTTAQAAHDGASVGDTIHLEPSVSNYGSVTITKRLTWISTGSFIASNPNLQASIPTGLINGITLNDIAASGSVFHCRVSTINISGPDNLRFERCHIENSLGANNSDNLIIINCFANSLSISSGNQNAIVSNNIINSVFMASTSSGNFSNNVFNYVNNNGNTFHNSTIQNSIFNKDAVVSLNASTINNSLHAGNKLPAGNGNVNNVDMNTVFVNPSGGDDVSFKLKAGGNPAVGAGVGGIDCGAYSGTTPFVSGLQPAVPGIYRLTVPATVSGNTMNIIFSTRSNN